MALMTFLFDTTFSRRTGPITGLCPSSGEKQPLFAIIDFLIYNENNSQTSDRCPLPEGLMCHHACNERSEDKVSLSKGLS
jgi:hypothetical protein